MPWELLGLWVLLERTQRRDDVSCKLKIQNLKVVSLDIDYWEVSWELAQSAEDVFDYTFQILRSESSMGPFDVLVDGLEDTYLFVDNNIPVAHDNRQLHYKVIVTRKDDGSTAEFGPVSPGPVPDLNAIELRKHMNILFREHVGRRCWILPVRTFGARCGCWDRDLQKRTRAHCETCYDTGFIRGYMHPIEAWVQFDPAPKNEQPSNVGPHIQTNTTARMGYFPELKPRDVVVEAENVRWRVTQVSSTQHLRAVVHQELQLHKVPDTDMEYSIPLELDHALKDLFITPARNYTNPHNLDNFEREEIPRIYSLYGSTYPEIKT